MMTFYWPSVIPSPPIKKLPLSEAIQLEAQQNFQRDQRLGLVDLKEMEEQMPIYLKEAEHLLATFGVGYDPEHKDHFLVMVE